MLIVWMLACSDDGDSLGSQDLFPSTFRTPELAGPFTSAERDDAIDLLNEFDDIPPDDEPIEVVARISASADAGEFPLAVSFDGTGSDGGSRFEWSFGDGAIADGEAAVHTFLGAGSFETTLTVVDDTTGAISETSVTIDVDIPPCPTEEEPLVWGHIDDTSLSEISGIVASRRDSDAFWVNEDSGNTPKLYAVDKWGATLGEYTLPSDIWDFEDMRAAIDPETGNSVLFLGDIGNNGHDRGVVAVWFVDEPDPYWSGPLTPLQMELDYPNGESLDSETLLVDPLTFDVYIVTKEYEGPSKLFVKRAPHEEGLFELEDLGEMPIEFTATSGDVSPDGTRIVIRDYSPTGYVWIRDGYLPLEDAFAALPCEIEVADEQQGEAIGFTLDGLGVVSVSEGQTQPLTYTEL